MEAIGPPFVGAFLCFNLKIFAFLLLYAMSYVRFFYIYFLIKDKKRRKKQKKEGKIAKKSTYFSKFINAFLKKCDTIVIAVFL